MSVTIIRHQAIGNKVGSVITSSYCGQRKIEFEAYFQLYMQSKAVDGLLMIGSWIWKDEEGAIEHFDNWVKEAQLEVEAA
jgi:hypothetical protein